MLFDLIQFLFPKINDFEDFENITDEFDSNFNSFETNDFDSNFTLPTLPISSEHENSGGMMEKENEQIPIVPIKNENNEVSGKFIYRNFFSFV